MYISGFSQEIRMCIEEMMLQRALTGEPGYDRCQRLLEYAAEEKSEVLFGLGYYGFAEHYLHESNAEKVLYCLTEGTKYFRRAGMYDYLGRAYNMMGAVAETQNNRIIALDYYYTGIQYAEKYNYPSVKAMSESNIANILFHMKQYRTALEKNQKAMESCLAAEKTPYTNWNIALFGIRSGLCHSELGETELAMEIYERLTDWMNREPEYRYPVMNAEILGAYCGWLRKDADMVSRKVERILCLMDEKLSLIENSDCVLDLARLLERVGDSGGMDRLLEILERKGIAEYMALALEFYPYRGKCLCSAGRTAEYAESTRRYFRLYRQYQKESSRATLKIFSLRERLHVIEKEQDRLLAYNQELQITARRDPMTGLANRTCLDEYMALRFEEACRGCGLLGVELLDIDYFKQFNDTYGHLAGDECIESVAGILDEISSANVFCARYGGDEFMIIYTNMDVPSIEETARCIKRKVEELRIPHTASGCSAYVSVSQGIFCHIPSSSNREWDFNSMADIALYEVKRTGRNHYCLKTDFSGLVGSMLVK